jgi:carbonic anhydrase
MSHKCGNTVIHCMDFRLVKDTINWMDQKGLLGDADLISIAGAGKSFLSEYQDFLMHQLDISINKHHSKKIFLVHHVDCGAYALENTFEDEEEEFAFQLEDMDVIVKLLENTFSDIEVIKVWAQFTENGITHTEIH